MGQDRKVLSFLVSERSRVRRAVLIKADLWQLGRTRKTIPNAHPIIKSWLTKAQWELWRWEACLSVLFWSPRIETASQQVFADDEFCAQTIVNWEAFFEIPRQISDSAPVQVAQVVYGPSWYDTSGLMGVSVRRALWKNSPPELRDYIRARHQQKYGGGGCGNWYSVFMDNATAMYKLEEDARNYLDEARERDFEEDVIATRAEVVMENLKLSLHHVIQCEEMNKVLNGKFVVETVTEGSALSNVIRLSKSNREIKTMEAKYVSQGGNENPGNGEISVDKGTDVSLLPGKEEPPVAPPKDPTSAKQVNKSDKKSEGVEVKKNETDEKRKDETGTGVENS